MQIFGMIQHQSWLFPLATYWTFHLTVMVMIQAGREWQFREVDLGLEGAVMGSFTGRAGGWVNKYLEVQ